MRYTERRRDWEEDPPFNDSLPLSATACAVPKWSKEPKYSSGSPTWVQCTKALGRPRLLSEATSRVLDGKWSSCYQNWHPYGILTCSRWGHKLLDYCDLPCLRYIDNKLTTVLKWVKHCKVCEYGRMNASNCSAVNSSPGYSTLSIQPPTNESEKHLVLA